jgi:hypothetical protein
MFIALLGLGFGACKKNSVAPTEELQAEKINKKSNITNPLDPIEYDPDPGYTAALGGLGGCITQHFGNGDDLRTCIGNIPVNTTKFVFRTSRGVTTPLGPGLSPDDFSSSYFSSPGTFHQLMADALNNFSFTTLSTQDSVDIFTAVYEEADYCVKITEPDPLPSVGLHNLSPEERLVRKYLGLSITKAHTLNIFNSGSGALYPSIGFKYLTSYAYKTLQLPLRWKQYGFDFKGEYTNLL